MTVSVTGFSSWVTSTGEWTLSCEDTATKIELFDSLIVSLPSDPQWQWWRKSLFTFPVSLIYLQRKGCRRLYLPGRNNHLALTTLPPLLNLTHLIYTKGITCYFTFKATAMLNGICLSSQLHYFMNEILKELLLLSNNSARWDLNCTSCWVL